MRLCLLMLLFTMPVAPVAAECPGRTQSDMDVCADQALRAADSRLNAAYKTILHRLRQNSGTRDKLVAAERAWLGFRDAECAFAAAGVAGGSIAPMIVLNCQADLTARRLKDLNHYLSCQEGDTSCPVPP